MRRESSKQKPTKKWPMPKADPQRCQRPHLDHRAPGHVVVVVVQVGAFAKPENADGVHFAVERARGARRSPVRPSSVHRPRCRRAHPPPIRAQRAHDQQQEPLPQQALTPPTPTPTPMTKAILMLILMGTPRNRYHHLQHRYPGSVGSPNAIKCATAFVRKPADSASASDAASVSSSR